MKCERLLNVYPPVTCVKIGDHVVDMEEGKNAGMWTIGLTRSGNMVGLDGEHWAQLPEAAKEVQLTRAKRILLDAGADYVVEDLASCNPALADIEELLKLSK